MFDARKLLDQFLGAKAGNAPGQPQQGVGALAALLLGSKGGRKIASTALQLGGMAVVDALAYKAYTASLLAIDVDNASERGYRAMLAARLDLDDALVKHLHATVEGATEPAPGPLTAPAG